MRGRLDRFGILLGVIFGLAFIGCDKEPDQWDYTVISGIVTNVENGVVIGSAYVTMGNELLAVTDQRGSFQFNSLEAGSYELVFSALNFSDQTVIVELRGQEKENSDVSLTPDDRIGRIYGEFHDLGIYNENLISNPSMADWNAKQHHDGVTGATLQSISFDFDLPHRQVYLGDSLVSISDDFGQYWFDMQCGTYPLKGSCAGYSDSIQVVKVEPDDRVYANYFLSKN